MGKIVDRQIYNPLIGFVPWPDRETKIPVKMKCDGILKYIDVYHGPNYKQTLLCCPLDVGKGDVLFINMTAAKKHDKKQCSIGKMHLPPVDNTPDYYNGSY